MHPVLFKLGGFSLHTYGLLVAIGFLFGIALAWKEAKRTGENPEFIMDLSFYLLLTGIIGSRLFYVVENFDFYRRSPLDIIKIWEGGLVYYGGLIPASIVGVWYLKKHNMRILKILDILAPSLAIGHVFGRMGCFFAGCCYGEYCDLPWAVVFDDPNSLAPLGFSLHPTQIYSSLGLLIIFLVLIKMSRLKKFEGQIFTGYLFLYSVFRFVIEYFRGDPRMMFFEGLFSIAQVISVGVALFSLIMFFYLRWQRSQFLETY